jgi:hypothetical protein
VLASGTPITNTLGEMFSVQRLLGHAALLERGLHEFDAWASTFGDASTELELQPSGKYKPVTRFAQFVNVPELIAMFRSFADVVSPEDLREYVKVPAIAGGKRQIVTAKATPAFRATSACSMPGSRRSRNAIGHRSPEMTSSFQSSPMAVMRQSTCVWLIPTTTMSPTISSTCSLPTPSASGRRPRRTPMCGPTASPTS